MIALDRIRLIGTLQNINIRAENDMDDMYSDGGREDAIDYLKMRIEIGLDAIAPRFDENSAGDETFFSIGAFPLQKVTEVKRMVDEEGIGAYLDHLSDRILSCMMIKLKSMGIDGARFLRGAVEVKAWDMGSSIGHLSQVTLIKKEEGIL